MRPLRSAEAWITLLVLQAVAGFFLFWEFFSGTQWFSYADIGSDTHAFFVPQLMHLADYVRQEGWPAWSFAFGLGGAFLYPADPFAWLNSAAGSAHVLDLRIWVYVLKLLIGGWAFHAFLRHLPVEPGAALFGAFAYTFCGYAIVNGQWDPAASELAAYPVLLWALAHRLQGGHRWGIPMALVFAMACSGFIVSILAFVLLCGTLDVLAAQDRRARLGLWGRRVLPVLAAGVLVAAPIWVPNLLLMFDSPRVGGLPIGQKIAEAFLPNDMEVLFAQFAGLWHKDLLGIGNHHGGWTNYFEGPGFYAGTALLLLIPQLARESGWHRRVLATGIACLAIYFALPVLRGLPYGFAVPYFRVSTLWITLLLAGLAVLALDRVLRRGVDGRILLASAPLVACAPAVIVMSSTGVGNGVLAAVLAGFAVASAVVLLAGRAARFRLPLLLALLLAELVVVGRSSLHRNLGVVTPGTLPHVDAAARLVDRLQVADPGFYRIEKTFDSISESDALAQGYFGVRSYGYHGRGSFGFFSGLGLVSRSPTSVNASNWLPGFGSRYPLYSLVGVRYVLSRQVERWPGFEPIASAEGVIAHRNALALPFGVVHTRRIDRAEFDRTQGFLRDVAMLHGVVTDAPMPGLPEMTLRRVAEAAAGDIAALYVTPALRLREAGLTIDRFSANAIDGRLRADAPGILVLSMPHQAGWSARVDGRPTAIDRVNLGLSGIRVDAGEHRVELAYRAPGLNTGLMLAAVGLLLLAAGGRLPVLFRRVLRSSPRGEGIAGGRGS